MRDTDLYRTILGLTSHWEVVDVEPDVKGEQVVVRVDAGPGPFPCPECQTRVPGYDRKPRRLYCGCGACPGRARRCLIR
ncbi:MAG: hypothetical protein HYY85_16980 [Deltaproteobacteria bacterium]|nr:hypothetical protein [Deltaproteobacteria bacterium]